MPTQKPRISITLEPDVASVYREFASLENRPVSTIISEMLSLAAPSISSTITLLQQAKLTSSLTRSELAEGLELGLNDLKTIMGRLGIESVEYQRELDDLIDKVSRPPATNRGVDHV